MLVNLYNVISQATTSMQFHFPNLSNASAIQFYLPTFIYSPSTATNTSLQPLHSWANKSTSMLQLIRVRFKFSINTSTAMQFTTPNHLIATELKFSWKQATMFCNCWFIASWFSHSYSPPLDETRAGNLHNFPIYSSVSVQSSLLSWKAIFIKKENFLFQTNVGEKKSLFQQT